MLSKIMNININKELLADLVGAEIEAIIEERDELKKELCEKKEEEKKNKAVEEIKRCINGNYSFARYFDDFAKDEKFKDKTPLNYLEYRSLYSDDVYKTYLNCAREYGFVLVDEVIQQYIDYEISLLEEEKGEEK